MFLVEVKWSASTQGKPKLPTWLHLLPSRHSAIAYLIGTPVTPYSRVIIHIIAKRLDNFKSAEQFITISLNDDGNFFRIFIKIYIKKVKIKF